jgi:hypothetical protein
MKNVYKILVRKLEGKGDLGVNGRLVLKWDEKGGCKIVDWILVAQDRSGSYKT